MRGQWWFVIGESSDRSDRGDIGRGAGESETMVPEADRSRVDTGYKRAKSYIGRLSSPSARVY
jgi:hypothetical protein